MMIDRFLDAGHHVGWVTGDEVYGGQPKLRAALEERGLGYVPAVVCLAEVTTGLAEVTTGAGTFRAAALVKKVPPARRMATLAPAAKGAGYRLALLSNSFGHAPGAPRPRRV